MLMKLWGEGGQVNPCTNHRRNDVKQYNRANGSNTRQTSKKKQWKKAGHPAKARPQEYVYQLNKCIDKTVIERKYRPTETMMLTEAKLLLQKEIAEFGNIGLGATQSKVTQFWTVEAQNTFS